LPEELVPFCAAAGGVGDVLLAVGLHWRPVVMVVCGVLPEGLPLCAAAGGVGDVLLAVGLPWRPVVMVVCGVLPEGLPFCVAAGGVDDVLLDVGLHWRPAVAGHGMGEAGQGARPSAAFTRCWLIALSASAGAAWEDWWEGVARACMWQL
jgi:hypothetical protein